MSNWIVTFDSNLTSFCFREKNIRTISSVQNTQNKTTKFPIALISHSKLLQAAVFFSINYFFVSLNAPSLSFVLCFVWWFSDFSQSSFIFIKMWELWNKIAREKGEKLNVVAYTKRKFVFQYMYIVHILFIFFFQKKKKTENRIFTGDE